MGGWMIACIYTRVSECVLSVYACGCRGVDDGFFHNQGGICHGSWQY